MAVALLRVYRLVPGSSLSTIGFAAYARTSDSKLWSTMISVTIADFTSAVTTKQSPEERGNAVNAALQQPNRCLPIVSMKYAQ